MIFRMAFVDSRVASSWLGRARTKVRASAVYGYQ